MTADGAYHELCAYTLSRGDAAFIHQHVVDAYAAQTADERTKPIGLAFALIGLYLHVEKQYTGREVQRVHMQLARNRRTWPTFPLPEDRGAVTAAGVLAAADHDAAIHEWAAAVWRAYVEVRDEVIALLRENGVR